MREVRSIGLAQDEDLLRMDWGRKLGVYRGV